MAATYHSVIRTVKLHAVLFGTSLEFFLKKMMDVGIMLTWFLAKSFWLQVNVKFKIAY